MGLDYDNLRTFRPAWRLLRADHALWIASFLQRVFVVLNVLGMSAADLTEMLEDEICALRQRVGPESSSALERTRR